jgi:hypothetical protein
MNFGFEEDSQHYDEEMPEMITDEENKPEDSYGPAFNDEEEEVQIIGGNDQQQVILQSIKNVEDAWNNIPVKPGVVKKEAEVEEVKEQIIEEKVNQEIIRSIHH